MADTPTKPLNVLWMSFGPIGDTLMMLALFDDILQCAPEARFTVLTSRNVPVIRDLSAAYPGVTILQIPSRLSAAPGFFLSLFRRRWVVLMPGVAHYYSIQLKLFFLLMYIRPGNTTIGFGDIRKRFGWLPFHVVLHYDLRVSILNNYRRMLGYFLPARGVPAAALPGLKQPVHVLLKVAPPDFSLRPSEKYILIHMFGTRPRLSFPPKRWKEWLPKLASRYPDYSFIFTGGKKDEPLIRSITENLPRTRVLIDRPILEVASLIKHAALYLGVDTGVTHISAVQRVQSVIVGNNSNPIWWPSYNPNAVILVNSARCTCTGDKNDDCRVYEDSVGYHRCTYDIREADLDAAIAKKVR